MMTNGLGTKLSTQQNMIINHFIDFFSAQFVLSWVSELYNLWFLTTQAVSGMCSLSQWASGQTSHWLPMPIFLETVLSITRETLGSGLGHQPSQRTFDLQSALPERCTGVMVSILLAQCFSPQLLLATLKKLFKANFLYYCSLVGLLLSLIPLLLGVWN